MISFIRNSNQFLIASVLFIACLIIAIFNNNYLWLSITFCFVLFRQKYCRVALNCVVNEWLPGPNGRNRCRNFPDGREIWKLFRVSFKFIVTNGGALNYFFFLVFCRLWSRPTPNDRRKRHTNRSASYHVAVHFLFLALSAILLTSILMKNFLTWLLFFLFVRFLQTQSFRPPFALDLPVPAGSGQTSRLSRFVSRATFVATDDAINDPDM